MFGQVAYVDPTFQNSGFTGIFGLGWPALSAEGVNPFVNNILPQLPEPLFTVWLNRFVVVWIPLCPNMDQV